MTEPYDVSGIQVIPRPENLYALIHQIRARPPLYLGENSISALHNFINGYFHACHVNGIDEDELPPWADFHEFVRARTGFSESTSGWCNMILSTCANDETKALATFFEMFEAFTSTDERGAS
jgi:hypothetical protein